MYSIMSEDILCHIHSLDAVCMVLAPATSTYEPRDPSCTILYTVVTEHLKIFFAFLEGRCCRPHEARVKPWMMSVRWPVVLRCSRRRSPEDVSAKMPVEFFIHFSLSLPL
jgi:hypothetical protein